MARSHPAQLSVLVNKADVLRTRNTVASFILLAALVSLAVMLHNQYGVRLARIVLHTLGTMEMPDPEVEQVADADAGPAVALVNPAEAKYRAIGDYLARRYKVSSEVTTNIVASTHRAGDQLKLDPLLILAVISIESRFNPIAESTMGAKGLMQVIPRFHREKFKPLGGEKFVFDPAANIMVGAQILKEYLARTGNLPGALQMYVGASTDENEGGFTNKVVAERARLSQILREYQMQTRAAQRRAAEGESSQAAI